MFAPNLFNIVLLSCEFHIRQADNFPCDEERVHAVPFQSAKSEFCALASAIAPRPPAAHPAPSRSRPTARRTPMPAVREVARPRWTRVVSHIERVPNHLRYFQGDAELPTAQLQDRLRDEVRPRARHCHSISPASPTSLSPATNTRRRSGRSRHTCVPRTLASNHANPVCYLGQNHNKSTPLQSATCAFLNSGAGKSLRICRVINRAAVR